MTVHLFAEYFKSTDETCFSEKKKKNSFWNMTAPGDPKALMETHVVFMPANPTSILQPVGQE